MTTNLSRFLTAQERSYTTALSEIKAGRKQSHWMWYIFPQIAGLGRSSTSEFYAISSLEEARAYLDHEILGVRLREISGVLLILEETNPTAIFGRPDDMKLRSSMTLFAAVDGPEDSIFRQVLAQYFENRPDGRTLRLLNLTD